MDDSKDKAQAIMEWFNVPPHIRPLIREMLGSHGAWVAGAEQL